MKLSILFSFQAPAADADVSAEPVEALPEKTHSKQWGSEGQTTPLEKAVEMFLDRMPAGMKRRFIGNMHATVEQTSPDKP